MKCEIAPNNCGDCAYRDCCEIHVSLAAARESHEKACCLVADMHKAAMGEVCGPKRGVVEDVSDLRDEADRLRKDRYALLSVKTKDGLLASEWVMRTATAEAELAKLRALCAELTEALEAEIYGATYRRDKIDDLLARGTAAGRGEGTR